MDDFHKLTQENQAKFEEFLRIANPDLYAVYNQARARDVNLNVLFHVIPHLAEIADGTGYGQVHILVENGMVRFVKGEHQRKVNELVKATGA